MDLAKNLEEAKAKRREIVEQVNALAEEMERLNKQRQMLLQEALRYDGEVRALEALVKEEKK